MLPSDYDNTDEFVISTVADLEAFSADTLKAGHNYVGKTVKLANDIVINDISVANWYSSNPKVITSITGNHNATDDNADLWGFGGTFDGQGHAIKGWIGKANDNQSNCAGAIFSALNGDSASPATVKNLVIDGFYSKLPAVESTDQGVIADQIVNGANIANVTMKNVTLDVIKTSDETDTNYGDHYSGIIAGTYYSAASKTGQGTEFWVNLSCVSVDASCVFLRNGSVVTASKVIDENIGGLFGRYYGNEVSSNFSMKYSSIAFKNVDSFGPMQQDGELTFGTNTTNIKVVINDVETDCGVGKGRFNDTVSGSFSYGSNSANMLHKLVVTDEGEDATCQKTGTADLVRCELCTYTGGGEDTPIVDHSYENGTCIWCTVTEPVVETTTKPDDGTTTPDAGTTTDPDVGTTIPDVGTTTAPTTADETTDEPTDGTTAAPVTEDDCASCSGAGAIAAIAVAAVSVFGLAIIIKKH